MLGIARCKKGFQLSHVSADSTVEWMHGVSRRNGGMSQIGFAEVKN